MGTFNGWHLVILLIPICVYPVTSEFLNVLFVNEKTNTIADEAYKAVLKYARRELKPPMEINDQYRAHGEGDDAEAMLESLCSAYNKSIDEGQEPLLVLDMTRGGVPSESTKSFTKLLRLPTVSASFGQEGDLRHWRTLDEESVKYLIQVMPPGDVAPELIRSFVNNRNISNAGILFDDTVVMDHKYKSLLQNVPTRHIINKVEMAPDKLEKQLKRFDRLEVFSYFIVGTLSTIRRVLDAGSNLGFRGEKYAWYSITLENGNVNPTKNATFLHSKPVQGTSTKDRLAKLGTDYGLQAKPAVVSAFYFDVMLRALMAAKRLRPHGSD